VRTLYWVVTLVVAVLLMLFAVSNREIVSLAFWPLPAEVDLPVYLLVLAALFAGFVVGAIAVWIGGHRHRRELWRRRRRIAALERELAATQSQLGIQADGARSLQSAS